MSKDTSYYAGAKYIKYAKFFMLYLYFVKTSLSIQNLMYLAHLEQERMQITVTEVLRNVPGASIFHRIHIYTWLTYHEGA